jgi:3-dehydroquinate synthetase
MGRDKKRRGGKLRFVLLERLGRPIVVDDVSHDELERAWSALRSEFRGGMR